MVKITTEDFEAWRASPMTALILDKFVASEMVRTKETHDAAAWAGPLEPQEHAAYRERYETLEWLKELTFEDVEGWMKKQQS